MAKTRIYKRGYQIQTSKPVEKPKATKPSGAGNPYGGYSPDYGMSKVIPDGDE